MDDILKKLNELKKNTEKLNPDFDDIKYNNEDKTFTEYLEQSVNTIKKTGEIIFSMTPKIKKIIFIFVHDAYHKLYKIRNQANVYNHINVNNYITENS